MRAVTRAAEARLECTGASPRPQPGTLRPVRDEPAAALAESEPTVEQPEPAAPPGAEMSGEK